MKLKAQILGAASAASIPEGEKGLWRILKVRLATEVIVPRDGKPVLLPPGCYTKLVRSTSDAPRDIQPGGEVVMEDTIYELRTHLDFMLRAFGEVLITGLGLGCVARGCLINPRVTKLSVIERDQDVIDLVWPHMPQDPRLQLVVADAVELLENVDVTADCAWHDLWSDPDTGEQHLALSHQRLIHALMDRVKFQGAWAWPRWMRRRYSGQNVI